MVIWTTRFSRKKAGIGLLVLILAVAAALILGKTAPGTDPQEQPLLATNEDRVAYLESLGWEVNPEPVETLQFLLPDTLEEPYLSYIQLQLAQGFDLTQYCGRRVKRYTYEITNYPTGETGIQAGLLVYKNTDIGTYVDYTTLVSSYTAKVKGGEVYNDIGSAAAKFDEVTYYVDGKVQPASVVTDLMSDVKKSNKDTFGASGKGVLTEVYVDTDEETIDVVIINTYIADVSADYNDKKEYLSVGVKNYGANAPTKVYLDDVAGIEKYKEDDVILVQIADGVILNVIDP